MSESNGAPELHQGAIPNEEAVENAADEINDTLPEGEEPEEKAAPASRKKKFQVKANNKIKDIELDLDNEDEIRKYLEKAVGAEEKFAEAAMTRKQAEALIELLRTNPRQVLAHPELGLDIKKLAHEIINEELEDLAKTPEQKKLEEMEKKLKDYEENEKKSKEEKRKAELEKFEMEQQQMLDDQITSALQSTTLPKSPYVVKRVADAMIEAFGMGYEGVTPEQVMPYVEESIKREIMEMFGAAPDEVMEQLLGKQRLDNYRKARVAKVKQAPVTAKAVKDTGSAKKEAPKEEPKLKFKDVFGPW